MEIEVENMSRKAHAGDRTAVRKSAALPSVPTHPELAYYGIQQKANSKVFPKAGVAPPIAIDTHLTPLGGVRSTASQPLEIEWVARFGCQLTP